MNNTIFITCASSGIDKVTAELFQQKGGECHCKYENTRTGS